MILNRLIFLRLMFFGACLLSFNTHGKEHHLDSAELLDLAKSATQYFTIQSMDLQRNAQRSNRYANLADSFGVTASYTEQKGINNSSTRIEDLSTTAGHSDRQHLNQRILSLDASLSFSLGTYYRFKQSEISEELLVAEKKAKQMSLASQLSSAWLSYQTLLIQKDLLEIIRNSILDISQKAIKLTELSRYNLINSTIPNINSAVSGTELELTNALSTIQIFRSEYLGKPNSGLENNPFVIQWLKDKNKEYDELFSNIPTNSEQAYGLSKGSIARVQSELAQKLAISNWYLALSNFGPTVSIGITKNDIKNDQTSLNFPSNYNRQNGLTARVSVSMNIPGGAPLRLKSHDLMIEASRLDTRDVEKQIEKKLKDLYAQLKSQDDKFNRDLAHLEYTLKIVNDQLAGKKAEELADIDILQITQGLATIPFLIPSVLDAMKQKVLVRLQILTLMGTLLNEI